MIPFLGFRVYAKSGVPLVLVGEADPLTRVNLRSTGVTLDEILQKVAGELKKGKIGVI